ncbi:MAG: hypothetical protein OZSIB_3005 [Candidatus Ozemobacter sibiricus]|uniref:Flavoprotein domain-containing protein n=1 Tax=Candidatus Ozemobacter sibiricus TaxID=2268124 RepID=A0A367ZTK8_9BACT|nr:MAG: hypothetical protein OZSIB_3005 [Candidatus Ozemobacter sibiricus]
MSHRAPPPVENTGLKPLLLCCRPEEGKIGPPDFLAGVPGLAPWEAAVSHSAVEHGWLRVLAARGPVFVEAEADRLLAGLERFDLLVVAPLSLNSLAKFALGLRDSFPARVFGAMADLGRPILLETSGLPRPDTRINPHYAKIYRRYWETLNGGSIAGFTPETFAAVIDRLVRTRRALAGQPPALAGRRVITRDDVLAAYQAMTPLVVPPGTLLTDLAREEAEARGVPIRFE